MSICCTSHVGSGSNWLCEDSGGEDVPDECRFAGGIDKNEWDSDACLRPGKPASGSTPDGLGPIQGRRLTPRFEHEDFMGRSNGFKKTQAWSRCEQSGHNANTCTIELVDRARGWGRSSFIPCLSCAMSFYSVAFMNEGIEECVEGILASGHQRAG